MSNNIIVYSTIGVEVKRVAPVTLTLRLRKSLCPLQIRLTVVFLH
jgi:hypothetical protein